MGAKLFYFIGLPGSGKSYAMQLLLNKANFYGTDMDAHIQYAVGDTISNFVNQRGWPAFREVEQAALVELTAKYQLHNDGICIIACGGGTPCFFDNIEFMKKNGTVVWFNTATPIVAARLMGTENVRPMLKDNDALMIKEFAENLLMERQPYYKQAHIEISDNFTSANELGALLSI